MKISKGQRIFNIGNSIFLIIAALTCVLPLVHIAAISFSSNAAASAGYVKFLPVEFNVNSYKYVLARDPFWRALWVSAQRVVLGVGINMFFTIIVAYPLSKESRSFKARTIYVWIFFKATVIY